MRQEDCVGMKIFLLIAFATLISCKSEQQKFVHHYQKFTHELTTKHTQLTPAEWDSTRMQYKIMREEAERHKPHLTPTEQAQIDSCNHKINALIIRQEANKVVNQVENFLNEAAGTIQELIK